VQLARNGRHGAQKRISCLDGEVQNLRDVLALVQHLQRFAVVALTRAHVAGHVHIGQKVHLHLDHAVALAGFAAATCATLKEKRPGP
jgi:hypothetical protein